MEKKNLIKMKRFKYKTVIRSKKDLLSDYDLNSYGFNGWELVDLALGDTQAVYVFKKED